MSNNNWNGEGLPKVGTLAQTHDGGGTVEAATVEQVCIRVGQSLYLYPTEQVMPIQTKAEIEKKEAIDEMVGYMPANQHETNFRAAEFLYKAGYHNGIKTKPLPRDWENRARRTEYSHSQWIIQHCGIEIEGKR